MRVLITGALGFIGSHLADAYIAAGHEVEGIDDRSGNVVDSIPGARVVTTDVRNVAEAILVKPDLVVHCASPVGAVALLEHASVVADVIEPTQAVLRYCDMYGGVPLVNISSSEVYGFPGVYSETDSCLVPHRLTHRLQYAAGKLAAEQLVRTSGLPAVSVRPFNVAGPRQSRAKGFVIPTFVEQALAGEPLTVFGGAQQRAFTGVWDVCDFIVGAHPLAFEPVFNVGNPWNRTTILDLAHRVIELTDSNSAIEFTDGKTVHGPYYEEAEGVVKVPDISLARTTGWNPTVTLDTLILRTVAEEVKAEWPTSTAP